MLIVRRKNQATVTAAWQCTPLSEGMSTDDSTGVKTRAMMEAQHTEGESNRELTNNPEQTQGTQNPAMNPSMDLHKTKEEAIKEFVSNKAQLP